MPKSRSPSAIFVIRSLRSIPSPFKKIATFFEAVSESRRKRSLGISRRRSPLVCGSRKSRVLMSAVFQVSGRARYRAIAGEASHFSVFRSWFPSTKGYSFKVNLRSSTLMSPRLLSDQTNELPSPVTIRLPSQRKVRNRRSTLIPTAIDWGFGAVLIRTNTPFAFRARKARILTSCSISGGKRGSRALPSSPVTPPTGRSQVIRSRQRGMADCRMLSSS